MKICKGEYINLTLLFKGAVELSEFSSGSILQISQDGTINCRSKVSEILSVGPTFLFHVHLLDGINYPNKVHEF
jgi:hypothetical protein